MKMKVSHQNAVIENVISLLLPLDVGQAKDIASMDWMSKSDPMCVLYEQDAQGEWVERSRTEGIKVCLCLCAFAYICVSVQVNFESTHAERRKGGLEERTHKRTHTCTHTHTHTHTHTNKQIH